MQSICMLQDNCSLQDHTFVESYVVKNQTVLTEFILLGLSEDPQVQDFLIFFFLVIFLVTIMANMTIILVIKAEIELQTPMYFFLSHLAFVDICFSSITIPKMLGNLMTKQKTISWVGCLVQIFFFFKIACTEVFILSAMGYDRYVAICHPLHYSRYLTKEICSKMVGGAWLTGFLYATTNVLPLLKLHFCGNTTIRHYSCELPSVLAMSCTETFTNYIVLLISGFIFSVSTFLFTIISYFYIISTILKMNSAEGRKKAFSTCSSHLIIVGLFYITGSIRYMNPGSESLGDLDKVISIQYNILTPMLNPIIYSLKNKEIKFALVRIFRRYNRILQS